MSDIDRQHVTDGGSCWCGATVEFFGEGHIVIHTPNPYRSQA